MAVTHDHGPTDHVGLHALALSATLHCLAGCAIGEILGLIVGTAIGLPTVGTIALAVGLAFVFGYTLSTLPVIKVGADLRTALRLVVAADSLSILTMEIVDNAVMSLLPGAMDAGIDNPVFWFGMMIALSAAFAAAYPVNRRLLRRGRGHALLHEYHHPATVKVTPGWRSRLPDFSTYGLIAVIAAFLLGGLAASAGSAEESAGGGHAKVSQV